MSANFKASTDGTQAIIGVGGVDQMTVNNAGVVMANSFVGLNSSSVTATGSTMAGFYPQNWTAKSFLVDILVPTLLVACVSILGHVLNIIDNFLRVKIKNV